MKKEIKVAFVIGHNQASQGANNVNDTSEYLFWNMIYNTHLYHLGTKFVHSNNSSYTQRQIEMSERTKDYDLVFELHFNAASSKQANGVEALVYHTNKNMERVGLLFCALMETEMCYKNRGVKKMSKGNGFGFLQKTKNDAILLEPFFGSNQSDCDKFDLITFKKVITETIKYYKSL